MTRDELLRILDFVDSNREIAGDHANLTTVDPRWNIISYAMRRHLEGKLLTVTSAASAADVPYGTAMRRLSELVDEGLLLKRPKSKTGKSFSLHPTRKLIGEIEGYALQLKMSVARTFGFEGSDGEIGDFFFGGSYMAPRILPYPNAMRTGVGYDRRCRILCSMDPTFMSLKNFSTNLGEFCGTNIEIINLSLDELHREILANAKSGRASKYDLVAVDLPWIGQLADNGIIEPLDKILADAAYNPSDFHTTAFRGSAWQGKQYGLPIQPTVELLFCREDLFQEAGVNIPESTDEILNAARQLHRSRQQMAGIVMNYGRGTPTAHSFIQTLADFGQPVINLRQLGEEFDAAEISGEQLRPMLDGPAAKQAAEFLLELLKFSHQDSLVCNWDRRIAIYSQGKAAMTYGWSVRAAVFELDEKSPACKRTRFVPHPPAPGGRVVSPLGGFSLAMPTGLTDERKAGSWKVMEYLTRPELLKWYVLNGNLTSPRYSTSADPEVQAASSLIGTVDRMARRGEIQTWPRPPIPEFSELLTVLGDEIHFMLQGQQTVEKALSASQNRIDAIMRESGYY